LIRIDAGDKEKEQVPRYFLFFIAISAKIYRHFHEILRKETLQLMTAKKRRQYVKIKGYSKKRQEKTPENS
jgi:hypothetical protein